LGAFGEVQVMDWGLAKVLPQGRSEDDNPAAREHTDTDSTGGTVRTLRTGLPGGSDTPPGSASNTRAGSVLGTPAYMSPEHARGEVDLVDERADVFSLGAILCEILTGQPPYPSDERGGDGQLERAQAGRLDGALERLNGCTTDAGLVDVCRQCLAVDPARRPRHAGHVADQVAAWRLSVESRLREAELTRAAAAARAEEAQATLAAAEARVKAERRARRLTVSLAGVVLLACVGGGGTWAALEQARSRRVSRADEQVDRALGDAQRQFGQAQQSQDDLVSWSAVLNAAERAQALSVATGASPDRQARASELRVLVAGESSAASLRREQFRRDEIMLVALDEARHAAMSRLRGNEMDWELSRDAYERAFREYGIDVRDLDPAEASRRVTASAIRESLIVSLWDWALFSVPAPGRHPNATELLRMARGAATDSPAWHIPLIDALDQPGLASLQALADRPLSELGGSEEVCRLAQALYSRDDRATAVKVLKAVQPELAGDFWGNAMLGELLSYSEPPDPSALRYVAAAAALRPELPAARISLASMLLESGLIEDAVVEYRRAIRHAPNVAKAHAGLGEALRRLGAVDEAIEAAREAVRLEPDGASYHYNLGVALESNAQIEDAVLTYQRAVMLDPSDGEAHYNLGTNLIRLGRIEEAAVALERAAEILPDDAAVWGNLPAARAMLGREEEAISALRRSVDLDPHDAISCMNLAHLLLHARDARLLNAREAMDFAQRAVNSEPGRSEGWATLGKAQYRCAEWSDAITSLEKAIAIAPNEALAAEFAYLAMAHWRAGDRDSARKFYQRSVQMGKEQSVADEVLRRLLAEAKTLLEASED
jgi:serine/threonine-protein kinase